MSDRELLEGAAKSAGIGFQWPSEAGDCCRRTDTYDEWNPLTDDGDALRLAVKLGLVINIDDEAGDIFVRRPWNADAEAQVAMGDDRYAATRRAIVLAAAEAFGKG